VGTKTIGSLVFQWDTIDWDLRERRDRDKPTLGTITILDGISGQINIVVGRDTPTLRAITILQDGNTCRIGGK
jgi:hypothetical protein